MEGFLESLEQESVDESNGIEIQEGDKDDVVILNHIDMVDNPEKYPSGSFIDLTLTKKENNINRVKYEQSLEK